LFFETLAEVGGKIIHVEILTCFRNKSR